MNTPYLLANNLLVETSLPLAPQSLAALEQALFLVQEQLRSLASDPAFSQKIALAFGNSFDIEAAQALVQEERQDGWENIGW